jgi:hypothetical protein
MGSGTFRLSDVVTSRARAWRPSATSASVATYRSGSDASQHWLGTIGQLSTRTQAAWAHSYRWCNPPTLGIPTTFDCGEGRSATDRHNGGSFANA